MRLMTIKALMLCLSLAASGFAQNSISAAISSFNRVGAPLGGQLIQAATGGSQAAEQEAHGRTERKQLETEHVPLEPLRESRTAQQMAAEGNLAADKENQVKAPVAQLADAWTQVRIEHLKVLAMKAREKHPDYDETMRHLNLPTSHAMAEAILDSELAAEIMYWLAKHPTDCKLIGDLQPLSAVREIGRIEGTIAPLAP